MRIPIEAVVESEAQRLRSFARYAHMSATPLAASPSSSSPSSFSSSSVPYVAVFGCTSASRMRIRCQVVPTGYGTHLAESEHHRLHKVFCLFGELFCLFCVSPCEHATNCHFSLKKMSEGDIGSVLGNGKYQAGKEDEEEQQVPQQSEHQKRFVGASDLFVL